MTVVFRAMGSEVSVTALDEDETRVAKDVAAIFREAEARFSRFDATSELAALNRSRGPFVASPPMFAALERARAFATLTAGVFDPGVGSALVRLGYDRSFASGALDRADVTPALGGSILDVHLDERTRAVHRPSRVLIDLGGMIKGATVDAAATALRGAGAIDAGGDGVVRGPAWLVDVEDPRDPSRIVATLSLSNAAVATSAANRRVWRTGTRSAHHLVDPRNGAPAVSDLLQATIVAPTAELADVAATTVFVLGAHDGRRFIERHPALGGVLVDARGGVDVVGRASLVEAA